MWSYSSRIRSSFSMILITSALVVSAFMPSTELGSMISVEDLGLNIPDKKLDGLTDPQEFEAFFDPLVAQLMESHHIPGGALAVVKDGKIFFAKGYGYADLERGTPATADTTIFRTGSVSKVFTWTAVMQLVEQGKLDLNADINMYLKHFQIPDTFDQPITLAHLMVHTAGFEDQISNGTVYVSADVYQPLSDFLVEKMPARIFPPGQVVAYSNYGTALAGEIVAEASGESFEEYVADHILEPLGMNHSTFVQPLPSYLIRDAAIGYEVDEEGIPHPGSFEFVQVQPAGALSATATDMATFMIAHLQDGRFGETRILLPESARDMRQQHYAFHPDLPGMTRGFAEAYRNNIRWVFHPGTTDLSSSLLALLPDQNLGIFIVFNSSISTSPRLGLVHALLDHYYPAESQAPVTPPAGFSMRAKKFTGSYLMTRRAETSIEKMVAPLVQVSVTSNPDDTLTVDAFHSSEGTPVRWAEVAPLLFQEMGGQSLLAFRADPQGRITAMFHSDQPILVFERLAWYENPRFHLAGLGVSLLIFVFTIISWSLGGLWRRVRRASVSHLSLERWFRALAWVVILLNLAITGLIVSVLVGDDSTMQFGYPMGFTAAANLSLLSGSGTVALLVCAIGIGRQKAVQVSTRLFSTLIVAAVLYFLWYLIEIHVFPLSLGA